MFHSIKYKTIAPVAVTLALLIVTIIVFIFLAVTNLSDSMMEDRAVGATRSVIAQLANFEEQSRLISRSVADNLSVSTCVLNWNADNDKVQSRQTLITHLTPIARDMGVDSFVVS